MPIFIFRQLMLFVYRVHRERLLIKCQLSLVRIVWPHCITLCAFLFSAVVLTFMISQNIFIFSRHHIDFSPVYTQLIVTKEIYFELWLMNQVQITLPLNCHAPAWWWCEMCCCAVECPIARIRLLNLQNIFFAFELWQIAYFF